MKEAKQVLVLRHDLKMRAGKAVSQGAHASISFLVEKMKSNRSFTSAEQAWINGRFTKICLRVDSEEELLRIYDEAKRKGLEVHLITDAGLTEFHGNPTRTCLAIGPNWADEIDEVTGDLKLL